MRRRSIHRSVVLAAVLSLMVAGIATADTVTGDADLVAPNAQSTRDLGTVAPGATLTVPVGFELRCRGLQHVDGGQTVTLTPGTTTVPSGGSISATDGSIGPIPGSWPSDGMGCSSPAPLTGTPSQVTIAAPPIAGGPYDYTIFFDRSLSPAGSGDGSAFSSLTAVTFTLTVAGNTPPVLLLPGDFTVEGDSMGGAIPAWSASATDIEDDPDPAATCSPAPGGFFALGSTVVGCSATDTAGATTTGSFTVAVVDTTAPALAGMPGPMTLGTADPTGRTVDYSLPSATDIVDPAPSVACAPAPGAWFPVGTTSVTCTATDASGNAASATFSMTVELLAVVFDAPIGPSNEIGANASRVIPVKVRVWRDGVELRSGRPALIVASCSGSPTLRALDLDWQADAGRWMGLLDTSGLGGICLRATVVAGGVDAGWFTIRQDGPAALRRGR